LSIVDLFSGKETGHDIDLLISHPVEGEEQGLLQPLLRRLELAHLTIHGRAEQASYSPADDIQVYTSRRGSNLKSSMDGFEKWMGVLKVDNKYRQSTRQLEENCKEVQITNNRLQVTPLNNNSDIQTSDNNNHFKASVIALSKEVNSLPLKSSETYLNDLRIPNLENDVKFVSDPSTSCCQDALETEQSSDTEAGREIKEQRVRREMDEQSGLTWTKCEGQEQKSRAWTARRIDLIVVPASQYYYGLVGWTGGKHFNRSLRLYSQRVLNMRLSSHSLIDLSQVSRENHCSIL